MKSLALFAPLTIFPFVMLLSTPRYFYVCPDYTKIIIEGETSSGEKITLKGIRVHESVIGQLEDDLTVNCYRNGDKLGRAEIIVVPSLRN